MIYKFNEHVDSETYDHWKTYLESKDQCAIVLPEYIDLIQENADPGIVTSEA